MRLIDADALAEIFANRLEIVAEQYSVYSLQKEEPMRDKLNCPNCGAPITNIECPYCGSVFYDFATLDSTKPTYIRMVWKTTR